MRRSRFARRIGPVVTVGVLVALPLLAPSVGSAATPGTWGVQQATYVDGQVCTNGNKTSPLAAWNFGDSGAGGREFLLTSVTSDGFTDSALLPQAGSPGRLTTPVSPGQYGMGSAADISTFAALISVFGPGPDPDAAQVAKAILDRASGGDTPNCVSSAAAQTLVSRAARMAGPYTVTASAATSPVAAGGSDSLTVAVKNTAGQTVPNAAVALSSPTGIFGGSGTSTVHTDSAGVAHVAFTVPQDKTLSAVTITATASVSVGLEAVTADGGFGQNYASAVFADPPSTYTANVSVGVSQGAAPVLSSRLSSTAITKSAGLALSEQLSGMFGHSGQVSFTILGPLKFDAEKLCAGYNPKSFDGKAPTAAKSNLNVVGDSLLTGGNWQPSSVGCYLLQSVVVTSDATPQATARGPQKIITVLDTAAAATPKHVVLGPGGAVTETVAVTNAYQRPGTVSSRLLGPLAPGSGDCRTVDWAKAKAIAVAATSTKGDGTYTVSTAGLSKVGCYQLQSALQLDVYSGSTARVPLTSTAAGGVFYVLSPTVSASADQTSVVSPAKVHTTVTVLDTFGQPGHVSVQMLVVASNEFGCRNASFAQASVAGSGAPVATTGDGTVTATSGPTSKLGCYALVPKLVMDDNPGVTVTGTPSTDNVVLAGVGIAPPAPRAKPSTGHSLLGTYLTLTVALLVLMAVSFAVFRYVLYRYREDSDDDDRPSPFGSRLGSLFGSSG